MTFIPLLFNISEISCLLIPYFFPKFDKLILPFGAFKYYSIAKFTCIIFCSLFIIYYFNNLCKYKKNIYIKQTGGDNIHLPVPQAILVPIFCPRRLTSASD